MAVDLALHFIPFVGVLSFFVWRDCRRKIQINNQIGSLNRYMVQKLNCEACEQCPIKDTCERRKDILDALGEPMDGVNT